MNSKLGVHIEVREQGWKEFVKAAKPCIVKSMDLGIAHKDEWADVMDSVRSEPGWENSGIFLLGRLYVKDQPLDNPADRALELWEKIRLKVPDRAERERFDAWEGYNETGASDSEQIKKLARFDVEFARILHREGLKSAAGGFSHSNPHLDIWKDYWEVWQEAGFPPDFLHLHEYSWPTMRTEEGKRCLYYRELYKRLPEGLRRPLIISECGLDSMAAGEDEHKGWLDKGDDKGYMEQLEWYDSKLQEDDYVIGATIFTYGATERWKSFDVWQLDSGQPAGMLKLLQDYLILRNTEPHRWWWLQAAPEPEPEPLPESGVPILIVKTEDGTPVRDAMVRLIGPVDAVVANEAAAAVQPLRIAWTREETGLEGSRWDCWVEHVDKKVVGITWREFMDQSLEHNPRLVHDDYVFLPENTYLLPENVSVQPEVFWTRQLTGFFGNRWEAWERFVKGRAAGIAWSEFVVQVVEHNPKLKEDEWVFRREETYWLPQNIEEPIIIAAAHADATGRIVLGDLVTPETYQVIVEATGFEIFRGPVALEADQTVEIILKAKAPIVEPVPSDAIRVSDSGEFLLGGQAVRFIGVNTSGLVHYGESGMPWIENAHKDDRWTQLQAAHDVGARVVRVFLANRNLESTEVADLLDAVLKALEEKYDMYAVVALTDVHGDRGFCVKGDDHFYSVNNMLHRDFFTGGYKDHYLPFVRDIVKRFKSHPRVFAWELGNELKPQDDSGKVYPKDFLDFANHVAEEIHRLDGWHLITTGIINTGNLGLDHDRPTAKKLYQDPNLHFLTVHLYPDDLASAEIARADVDAQLARELNKPLVVEEIGFQVGDRAAKTREAMRKWLEEENAKGLMQWGFMATENDCGDGDKKYGMHRAKLELMEHGAVVCCHTDYDALKEVYQERAEAMRWGSG